MWLQGGTMIGSRETVAECEVFLDDAGAQGDRGQGNFDANGVVGEAGRYGKPIFECLHGAKVHAGRGGRIVADAMQEDERGITFGADDVEGGGDFFESGHTG